MRSATTGAGAGPATWCRPIWPSVYAPRFRDTIGVLVALRILIVEDDKHIRRILESLIQADPGLVARGAEIVIAEDGKEGLEALDQGRVDLVVSDLLMPRMDGFTFCRELRKHKHGKDVPLIVTSAIYKDQNTLQRLHTETGAEFFAKPFQVRE